MKKIIAVLFVLILAVLPLGICASAADLTDGTYEVPVVLMHKEDEEESFGNKFVAQTALLEVENGKKTITILLTTNMKGIEFSYYTDGSLSGDVAKGVAVSNVTVAGEAYNQGFEIPVMADGDIGLQFSVPVMPMSPSARLRIDYGKALKLSEAEETTTPQATTTAPATQTTTVPATAITTTVPAPVSVAQTPVTEATTFAIHNTVTEVVDKEGEGIPSFVFFIMFFAAVAGMIFLFSVDSSKEITKNDDK